jgi:hypothetical protein
MIRFVGRYRKAAQEISSLDDSGYDSPTQPSKRQRLEAVLSRSRLPLIEELESGYSCLYLTKDFSLSRSYASMSEPPIMDDPKRVARALNLSPNFTGGLRDQIEKTISFRQFPPQPPVLVDLTQD